MAHGENTADHPNRKVAQMKPGDAGYALPSIGGLLSFMHGGRDPGSGPDFHSGGVSEPRRPRPSAGSGGRMRSQPQSRNAYDANPSPVPRRVMGSRYTSDTRLVR